jgi:hypothetical protein
VCVCVCVVVCECICVCVCVCVCVGVCECEREMVAHTILVRRAVPIWYAWHFSPKRTNLVRLILVRPGCRN